MKLLTFVLAGLLGGTQLAAADDLSDPYAGSAPEGSYEQAPPQAPVQGPRRGGQRGRRGAQLRQLLVQRFDANGDGRLEGRERRQAARALRQLAKRFSQGGQRGQRGQRGGNGRQKLIQKYDLDHDGNVGPGELPPRVQQGLRRMDRNGDGWVDQGDRR
ncbi:MAG: hypothetical protein IPQ07_19085 [Myxococcales bacterium]|nr:hypothetical protein [Myxococcales bacterium]